MINAGDIVRIKPQYAEGDDARRYVVLDSYANHKGETRCIVTPLDWVHGGASPQENVAGYMLCES